MSAAVELRERHAAACQADRWTEGLPPPPPTHVHISAAAAPRECTIPRQPAKPWDRGSDGDDSDEGVDSGEKLCGSGGGGTGDESDSTMETESECPTEIYVPGLLEKKPYQRGSGAPQATTRLIGEVLPSVLSAVPCSNSGGSRQGGLVAALTCSSPLMATAAVSARGRLIDAATAACDDTAMNIDSGISNETGGENGTATSGDCGATGTVVLRRTVSDVDGGGGAADALSLASSRYSSSYSCGSRGDAHPPMMLGQGIRERELQAHMKHQKRLRISSVLSGCYAITATALSIVLASSSNHGGRESLNSQQQLGDQHATRLTADQQQQQPAAMDARAAQVFYMYLYTAGLAFLTYCYVSALRDRAVRRRLAKRKSRQAGPAARSASGRPRRSPVAQAAAALPTHGDSGRLLAAGGGRERQADVGSLFLRMCTAAFCVCCMVDNGIRFGVNVSSGCSDLLDALHPMAQLIFTFAQMYFIFVNSQMRLSSNVGWAKFGVAHLVATNVSMWLHRLLQPPPVAVADQTRLTTYRRDGFIDSLQLTHASKTALGVISADDAAGFNITSPPLTSLSRIACSAVGGTSAGSLALRDLLDSGEPYLTRLTVHYFLLSTALLLALWARIGRTTPLEPPCAECAERSLRRRLEGARTIDCRRTGLGLAAGALLLAAALGSLVAYYALRRIEPDAAKDGSSDGSSSTTPGSSSSSGGSSAKDIVSSTDAATAELLLACYQMAGCCLTLIVAVAALLKLARLDHNDCRATGLEDSLLGVGTAAVLARDVRLIAIVAAALCGAGEGDAALAAASAATAPQASWLVVLTAAAFDALETVVQSTTVALALRLRCRSSQDAQAKPGRQCLSFLLVANLALWAAGTFAGRGATPSLPEELLVNPTASTTQAAAAAAAEASGEWLRPLLTHAVEPAALAYRLIAAACLADVWHDLYRSPPTDIV